MKMDQLKNKSCSKALVEKLFKKKKKAEKTGIFILNTSI